MTDASPRTILEIATAFQRSRALLTAFELGVFTVLNDQRLASTEVAEAIGAEPRATDRLMNVLVGLGLLEKADNRFANTPLASAHLVKGRPGYMGGLAHTVNLWSTWSGLTASVREGRPVHADAINDRGADWLRPFIAAMHWRARQTASEVVAALDLSGVSRVLDVGGGSGAYAMAFARARAGISAVVFDLPNVVPLTQAYIREESLASHVETRAGDYMKDPIGEGYDLVFMSAVIHSHPPHEARHLFRKAAAALRARGQLVVQDFLMADDRTGPLQASLFALNMLVGTTGGDTYTEAEVREWMGEAGFREITRKDTSFGANLLMGRR